jgi:transcription initiation factor IIE alpha subunit
MFFTECARLAEQHPDLASVFERLDSQLRAMGTAEVIRPDDLASFLNIDPNQMRSALVMFAQEGVLHRVEMIECPYCQMAALRSEYQEALDEDDEYRCTSCDRRLTEKTIHIITTYRRGEKWQEVSNLRDGSGDAGLRDASASSASIVTLDEQGWYTHVRLAESFSVGKEALRKRLDRYREHKLDGWKRQDDRRPREPKYLYRLQDVKGVIQELASSERPAN